MSNGEEKIIVEKAISGESSAFGLLYDKYQPQIYRFIYLKTSHREEAEDLTHQVFLNAWQKIENYKFKGYPFSTWLYQIARNEVIDFYRTRKSNLNIETIPEPTIKESFEKKLDINLELEKIKKAIIELSSEQQNVIIMRFVNDIPLQEIADAMGKSNGAIRILQYRAIKNLQKNLSKKQS